jgi:hypothetical protein
MEGGRSPFRLLTATPPVFVFEHIVDGSEGDGVHPIDVYLVDRAGNSGMSETKPAIIDTVPPPPVDVSPGLVTYRRVPVGVGESGRSFTVNVADAAVAEGDGVVVVLADPNDVRSIIGRRSRIALFLGPIVLDSVDRPEVARATSATVCGSGPGRAAGSRLRSIRRRSRRPSATSPGPRKRRGAFSSGAPHVCRSR